MTLHGEHITLRELVGYSRESYGIAKYFGESRSECLNAALEPSVQVIREALCDMFGHYYRKEDSFCDAENGYEAHHCCRCGHVIDAQY